MAENISEKKSRVVTYNGNDSKIKMLVEALNYNTEDTLHDQVTYNGSTQETRTGDIDVVWGSDFTINNVHKNYTGSSSSANTSIIKWYNNSFKVYVNEEAIKRNTALPITNIVGHSTVNRKEINFKLNEEWSAHDLEDFRIIVTVRIPEYSTYFYTPDPGDDTSMLGLIIALSDTTEYRCESTSYWTKAENETFGGISVERIGPSSSFKYDVYFLYQSFYRDDQDHTYEIDLKPYIQASNFNPYNKYNLTISLVMDCLITNQGVYREDEVLVECSSIVCKNVVNGQFINKFKQFNGREWINFTNPGADVLYGKDFPVHTYGRSGDVYFKYSDDTSHNQLSNLITSVNEHKYKDEEWDGDTKVSDAKYAYFNTWKYDDNLTSNENNGVSFSYSGYNLRYLRKAKYRCILYDYDHFIPGQPIPILANDIHDVTINDEADLYFRINDLPNDKEYKFYVEFYMSANSSLSGQVDDPRERLIHEYPNYSTYTLISELNDYERGILIQNDRLFDRSHYIYRDDFSDGTYKFSFECITSNGYIDFHLGVQAVDKSDHLFSYRALDNEVVIYESVEDLIQYISEPQYKKVYLVGDEREGDLTPYYWNGTEFSTTPRQEDLLTVTITGLKISYVSSFDSVLHKLDDIWIEQKSSGGGSGGSDIVVTPILQSGVPIAGITVDQNSYTLYAPNGGSYELPIASSSTLGGIKVGSGLSINPSTGELSATGGGGGGTTVVPNPVGTPTDNLNTVQIGQTIYDIPDGVEAIELTKAAYESKSQAEKEDPTKVYFVTDYETEDATYSTTETVIGKWIDGKPIYRIVLDYHQTPITNLGIDVSALSIDTLIRTDALGTDDSSNYAYPKWTLNSVSGSNSRLIYMQNATTLKVEGSYYKYWIILEYTKTTDS